MPSSKIIVLSNLKAIVADDAYYLLDIKNSIRFNYGLGYAIRFSELPGKIQYLLFSATFNKNVKTDIEGLLKQIIEISIKKQELIPDCIKHFYFRVTKMKRIVN